MTRTLAGWTAALLLLGAGLATPAQSAVITYTTPPGATQGGLSVSVSATFTTGLNSLSISVSNLLANPTSVIQNLSDIDFVFSTSQTTVGTGGGLTSSSGVERTVGKSPNTFTDGKAVSTGWGLKESFSLPFSLGTGFTLCLICPAGGTVVVGPTAQPEHTIIGPDNGSGLYSNAGGSIAGNAAHNPFLIGPVTFNLSILGLTSASTISAVVFSFGTEAGSNTAGCVQGQCTAVPGAGPLLLIAVGVVGGAIGSAVRKRRRTA